MGPRPTLTDCLKETGEPVRKSISFCAAFARYIAPETAEMFDVTVLGNNVVTCTFLVIRLAETPKLLRVLSSLTVYAEPPSALTAKPVGPGPTYAWATILSPEKSRTVATPGVPARADWPGGF